MIVSPVRQRKPRIGDVVQFALPNGRFAYGRVLTEGVAFYRETTDEPGQPPVGSRDYQFVVGVYDDVVRSPEHPVVGHDPSADDEDDWPPPQCVRDVISGGWSIYHKGEMRPSSAEQCSGMEPVAAWDERHLVERLLAADDNAGDAG